MQQPPMFKLDQNPNGRGLRCNRDGLFLAGAALLQKNKEENFEARPTLELRKSFGRLYGDEADWDSRIRSVRLVASALNKGDMARAMMTAVLMRLPDPGDQIRIADVDGALAKAGFNPDEPRDEQGRWTTGGGANSESEADNHGFQDRIAAAGQRPIEAPHANRHPAGVQLADAGLSDASDDPMREAAVRAAEAARQVDRSTGSQDSLTVAESASNSQSAPTRVRNAGGATLTYVQVQAPTYGAHGQFSWQIRWQLSRPSPNGGWIVQRNHFVYVRMDAEGHEDTKITTFWEAWPIAKGAYEPNIPGYHDAFHIPFQLSSSGSFATNHSARYYDGLQLPSIFKPGHKGGVPIAGDLYSTYQDPHLPVDNATPPVRRHFMVTWP